MNFIEVNNWRKQKMKRKIFWGSVIIVLLMLVSSQIVFLNAVKSDPSSHTGDADVGRLWISELNVESAAESFDFIGIGHTNATDDWVLWENGVGNITADWNVDIDNNHPEYHVRFYLMVFNVDIMEDDNEIGNATFEKTYNENTSYDESGILTVALEFTPEQMEEKSQTLVCYIQTWVTLNETQEAVNFTSSADDRAVVAVDFENPLEIPQFSTYVNESNEKFPSMWSWIDGWEEIFESEEEMLNTQTYFEIGVDQATPEYSGNSIWYMGNVNFQVVDTYVVFLGFEVDEQQKEWEYSDYDGLMHGPTRINYTRVGQRDHFPFTYGYYLTYENVEPCTKKVEKTVKQGDPRYGYLSNRIKNAEDVWAPHDIITIGGWLWCKAEGLQRTINLGLRGYSIKIVEDGDNYIEEVNSSYYYWEDACSYHNVSEYSADPSSSSSGGITTVEANIYEIVGSTASDEHIYTFAGDSGNVRVSFICEP